MQSNPRRDIPSAGSSRWSRPGRGNPVAPRRARPRKFQPLLRRLRLRHKSSARASGGPAGGRRVGACLGRWRALSRRARAPVIFSRCYAACACGTKARRGPPAALPGADVWGHAWGDGAHCRLHYPCTAAEPFSNRETIPFARASVARVVADILHCNKFSQR